MKTVLQVLVETRELLGNPDRWTQGVCARKNSKSIDDEKHTLADADCYCLVGALLYCSDVKTIGSTNRLYQDARQTIIDANPNIFRTHDYLNRINDSQGYLAVLNLLDNAIVKCSITSTAAKFIYKLIIEKNKKGEDTSSIKIRDLVEEHNLWLANEWTHLGCCIVVCLENKNLVDSYKKGNQKVFEALVGKTIKYANMTVDAELIRELLPLVITNHF